MPNQTHHTLTAWFLSYSIQDRDIFTSVSHILSRGDFIVMISILFYQPAHFQYNEICSNYLDQNIICNVNRTYKHKRVNILVLRIHTLTTRNQMSPVQTLNLLLFWTRHQMGLMCSICSETFSAFLYSLTSVFLQHLTWWFLCRQNAWEPDKWNLWWGVDSQRPTCSIWSRGESNCISQIW